MRTKKLYYISIFIIAAIIGLYIRGLPYIHKEDSELFRLAEYLAYQKIKTDLGPRIDKHFPDMNKLNKEKLLKAGYQNIALKNKDQITSFIDEVLPKLKKSFRENRPPRHLIAADSYYYLGLTKNIAEQKTVSKDIKNGLYYNPLMLAPYGHKYYFDLHPYAGYISHRFISFFKRSVSLEEGVGFTSLILVVISLFIFIYFAYKENLKAIPVFIGSMFFLASPMFLQRSLLGWYDTDPYNIIFPALVILCLFSIYNTQKSLERLLYTSLSAVFTALYTMFWSGWIFMLYSTLISFLLIAIWDIFKKRKFQNNALYPALYIGLSFFLIILLRGFEGFLFSFKDTYIRLSTFLHSGFNLWPNAFLTVGELKKVSLHKIFVLSGGRIFSGLALSYLVISIFKNNSKTNSQAIPLKAYRGITLLSFIIIPFVLSIHAERFTILLVTPLAFAFMFFVNDAYIYSRKNLKSPSLKILVSFIFLSSIIVPIQSSYQIASRRQPMIYDAAWDKSMEKIKNNTPKDSIINTWWSPGHFITSMGRRRVLFDGATLENPVGYWIAKVFLSQNEAEAIGLLRMLNLSGNKASRFLIDKGLSLSQSVDLITSISSLSKDKARNLAKDYLDDIEIDQLLALTHGEPSPGYILLYNDLIEKSLALCFMGNWDFKKAEDFKKLKEKYPKIASEFIKKEADNDYIRFLWGISGGPVYYDEASFENKREGELVHFTNGLWVNPITKECDFLSEANRLKGRVKSLIYQENGRIKEKIFTDGPYKLSVILTEEKGQLVTVLADRKLAKSLLFKLYYFNGIGVRSFKHFSSEEDPKTGTKIQIYLLSYPLPS